MLLVTDQITKVLLRQKENVRLKETVENWGLLMMLHLECDATAVMHMSLRRHNTHCLHQPKTNSVTTSGFSTNHPNSTHTFSELGDQKAANTPKLLNLCSECAFVSFFSLFQPTADFLLCACQDEPMMQ